MKNKRIKAKVNSLLLQIHKGFLPEDAEVTDAEILANIPTGLAPKENLDGETDSLVAKPFTYKWVSKRVKKWPTVTAFDLLVEAGFREPDGS